jgi:hypothetical protein
MENGSPPLAGDHVAVRRRRRPWEHHGVVLQNGAVFELHRLPGLGIEVRDLPFVDFADGSSVRTVAHGRNGPRGVYAPLAASSPEVVFGRVETLRLASERGLLGRYWVLGCNCEHLVNWCLAGDLDSVQVRKLWFGGLGLALTMLKIGYVASVQRGRTRRRPRLTGLVLALTGGQIAVTLLIHRRIWKLSHVLADLDRERREKT